MHMEYYWTHLLWILWSMMPGFHDCFNIDTRNHRIIKGPRQTQFGYTVQQHMAGGQKCFPVLRFHLGGTLLQLRCGLHSLWGPFGVVPFALSLSPTTIGSVAISRPHGLIKKIPAMAPPSFEAAMILHPGWFHLASPAQGFSLAPPTICITLVSPVITSPRIPSSTYCTSST
ncbi:Integrin alpha-11 [Anabarilius grahami]|uniref:Integrin alpha-11 n=1 Tax=Anabarilius grahami TaxID=495550 RepID=A0A3N0Z2J5_ANAGA|nr:Integrin alpha-11 [Anabarilius grahami]